MVDLYRALTELARRYQFRNRDEICCYGLTVSQCYALQTLQDGEHHTGVLSEKLGLDISSTTRLVDQLVRKKLVQRKRGVEDGRVRQIELTDAGKKLMSRIEKDFAAFLAEATKDIPDDVRKQLPQIIRQLNQALQCGTDAGKVIPVSSIKLKRSTKTASTEMQV
ncbi:MAG TPA: MarR family winged helix-turn-helix transcriptional regulator [Acidobacteriota bacterium]|nr:MarR family winged helix-turn-helix transcriptional regulator [Acidobacteriota bacterium]